MQDLSLADLRLLNQTNIAAHDKFAQTRFYTSVMVMKLGAEFGADFEKYKNLEDGAAKSEAGFMRFLEQRPRNQTMSERHQERFRSYLYNSCTGEPPTTDAAQLSSRTRTAVRTRSR